MRISVRNSPYVADIITLSASSDGLTVYFVKVFDGEDLEHTTCIYRDKPPAEDLCDIATDAVNEMFFTDEDIVSELVQQDRELDYQVEFQQSF